jgi:hypothetical protein
MAEAKSHLVQAIGLEVLKTGFVVLYRSIFDLVRELLTADVGLYSTAAPFSISYIPSSSRTHLLADRIYPIGHS